MSFHEKNAWGCLLALLIVYIPYFAFANNEPITSIILLIVSVIFLVILLSGFHLLNAIFSPGIRSTGDTPPLDERDKLIDLKATKISGVVLGSYVITWCLNAFLRIPWAGFSNMSINPPADPPIATFAIPAIDALWWVQLLFAGIVLANLVYYASVIFQYRRAS